VSPPPSPKISHFGGDGKKKFSALTRRPRPPQTSDQVSANDPSRCTVGCDLGQSVHTHCPAPLKLRPYGAI